MRTKLLVLTVLVIAVIFLTSSGDQTDSPQRKYEQNPPIASHFWVQQLATPLSNGT